MSKPDVLILTGLPPSVLGAVKARYGVVHAPDAASRAAVFADRAGLGALRAVVTNGGAGISAAQIEALPALEVISVIGVGSEGVDQDAARRRGIPVVDGRGTLEDGVADHALALLLALARDIPAFDLAVKTGAPRPARLPVSIGGKRLGILGLGDIGLRIARRAEAFGLSIGYHNRNRRGDVAYAYFDSPAALAAASDFLVVVTPGGAETRHLVNAGVLAALGPQGRLINVGRGSVVDTAALVDALESGGIAGAALDVFEGEPNPPPWLIAASNLILTPHQAANSPERQAAMARRILETLDARLTRAPHLEGAQP